MAENNVEKSSESWNIAEGYSYSKILKLLVDMDRLVWVSSYGYEKIEDRYILTQQQITEYRIEALERLTDSLQMVIENSMFALKDIDKNVLNKLRDEVLTVIGVFGGISQAKTDMTRNTKVIYINEDHFKACLKRLRQIKEALNEPLNRNGLIFRQSEETDLDMIKKRYMEGG